MRRWQREREVRVVYEASREGFVLQRARVYGAKHWTPEHHARLAALGRDDALLEGEYREILQEPLTLLAYKQGRRTALDQRIATLALRPESLAQLPPGALLGRTRQTSTTRRALPKVASFQRPA